MQTEKILCLVSMVIAGLLTLVFLLDAAVKIPFDRPNLVLDILFILAGSFVLWQGFVTMRDFK